MIITRGLGKKGSSNLLSQGYGNLSQRFLAAIARYNRQFQIRLGQSGTKRRQREDDTSVSVSAKMLEANGSVPGREIKGHLRTSTVNRRSAVIVEYVSRLKATWETIKVTVQRL